MYIAPSKAQAQALKQVLARETDYNVTAEPGEGGGWIVEGSTQPSAVTLEILDQWVEWMITAGLHEGCGFDGWGTEIPEQ